MLRVLPVLIAIVLAVYCLVDVIQRRSDEVRYLPRWAWGAIIVLAPIVGPIGWLVAGRPPKQGGEGTPTTGEVPGRAPDDDPDFLAQLHKRRQREQEEKLKRWQEELEERERDLQRQRDDDEGKGPNTGSN